MTSLIKEHSEAEVKYQRDNFYEYASKFIKSQHTVICVGTENSQSEMEQLSMEKKLLEAGIYKPMNAYKSYQLLRRGLDTFQN